VTVDCSGHYTGSYSSHSARKCSKPLWSSEDYADSYDYDGGGCLARVCSFVLFSLNISFCIVVVLPTVITLLPLFTYKLTSFFLDFRALMII